MPSITFDTRAYAALALFTSTEETRYYLNGVHFEPHPSASGVLAVATDGHRMGIYYDAGGTITEGPFILPVPKLATRQAGKAKEGDRLLWKNDIMSFERIPMRVEISPIDGTFVDWRRGLPDDKPDVNHPPKGPSCFNTRYLAGFHAALCLLASRSPNEGVGIQVLTPSIQGGPSWAVAPAVPAFRGVIMPILDQSAPGMPGWLA